MKDEDHVTLNHEPDGVDPDFAVPAESPVNSPSHSDAGGDAEFMPIENIFAGLRRRIHIIKLLKNSQDDRESIQAQPPDCEPEEID